MRYAFWAVVLCAGMACAQDLPENTNEIKTLTLEQAQTLAKREGALYLNGLATLSDQAATALALHKGVLQLTGLTTLSPEVAEALAKHEGDLSLIGLPTLTPEVAESIAKHDGTLRFPGLSMLSDAAAVALAKHKGHLYLDSLTTLSDEALGALAQHKSALSLNGLTTLSEQGAKALAHHEAPVFLSGLKTLSKQAAQILIRNDNGVRLLRRPSGEFISLDEIDLHEKECLRVDEQFLPKYLKRHPDLLTPYPPAVGYEVRAPFGKLKLSPARFPSTFHFWCVIYSHGMSEVLAKSMQPIVSTGQPDRLSIARAIESCMDPDNCFLEAKDMIWGATSTKDKYLVVGKEVLTHEEAWSIAMETWAEVLAEQQKNEKVPRVPAK